MSASPRLRAVEISKINTFAEPVKRIHDGADVQFFLQSLAYRDVTTFILQLNRSMVPRRTTSDNSIHEFRLDHEYEPIHQVRCIQQVITNLDLLISEAPPDTGPRRFGNISFRKWYKLAEECAQRLLEEVLPVELHPAIVEYKAYLLGSFGSPQRLDYGTGHELSFIAFLASLWKTDYFSSSPKTSENAGTFTAPSSVSTERQIVLLLFQRYLSLIRKLIVTYNLEPAGSHGVWGLDDNSFLPYLFGSAQFCPPLPEDKSSSTPTPTSGSLPSSPDPSIVTKQNLVEKEAKANLYFSAIDFIYTVKRGPFWEHSPILFDISGIKDGWGKINKGLIKMYDAEVLAKFPVVQHFPFGGLFAWEKDPDAKPLVHNTHTASQPLRDPRGAGNGSTIMRPPPGPGVGTAAPWAASTGSRPPPAGFVNGVTQAPWANAPVTRRAAAPSLRSQASRPTGNSARNSGLQSLQWPDQRPVSAASPQQVKLAEKTAETIPEEKT